MRNPRCRYAYKKRELNYTHHTASKWRILVSAAATCLLIHISRKTLPGTSRNFPYSILRDLTPIHKFRRDPFAEYALALVGFDASQIIVPQGALYHSRLLRCVWPVAVLYGSPCETFSLKTTSSERGLGLVRRANYAAPANTAEHLVYS